MQSEYEQNNCHLQTGFLQGLVKILIVMLRTLPINKYLNYKLDNQGGKGRIEQLIFCSLYDGIIISNNVHYIYNTVLYTVPSAVA